MIKKSIFGFSALVGSALLAFGSSTVQAADVLATAQLNGKFSTLVKAIEAAGLTAALSGPGPMTVFAPTDEAFAKLPAGALEDLLKPENKDKLVKLLTYHVVAGRSLGDEQLKVTRSAATIAGQDIRPALVRGRLRINDARVGGDINASNGVIHSIDRVLMPN